jgi:hypothetical protein
MQLNESKTQESQCKQKSFIFKCDNELLNEIRAIAKIQRVSIAHFLRKSAMRSVARHKRFDP